MLPKKKDFIFALDIKENSSYKAVWNEMKTPNL